MNNFRDQKAENKFGSSFGKKGTQANFLREQGPPREALQHVNISLPKKVVSRVPFCLLLKAF